jgi:hypothetical protein
LLAQINPHHFLDGRENEDKSGAFGVLLETAKGKDYAALIFAQDAHAHEKVPQKEDDYYDNTCHIWWHTRGSFFKSPTIIARHEKKSFQQNLRRAIA